MLLLGFFLLLAKYSESKFGKEGDSEATLRGKNIQRVAEHLGKESEEKERRRENGVSDKEKYRFKDSGIGCCWQIGDDSEDWANAYVNGMNGCEENLEIPHNLTDENQNTRKVEVIGQNAFYRCGDKDYYGKTRSIVLSRYIKVIKRNGLGYMDDVTSFEVEEGSCLESIEYKGLSYMSFLNKIEDARSGILVLPSTVTNIAEYGLHKNNLNKTIYYCGSTHLSNYSTLVNGVSAPDIKVTSLYKYDTIFRDYKPNNTRESIAEAEEICDKYKPEASPSQPTAGFPGRPNSLLSWMGSGRRIIGSLRRGEFQRGEFQRGESDPVEIE